MRCKNCGWENSDRNNKCVKCNAPLERSRENLTEADSYDSSPANVSLKKTVFEGQAFGTADKIDSPDMEQKRKAVEEKETIHTCPYCAYPMRANDKSCPNCGKLYENPVKGPGQEEVKNDGKEIFPNNKKCPFCNAIVPLTANFCSVCGSKLDGRNKKGTINPWEMVDNGGSCTLTIVPRENEKIVVSPLAFDGNEIVLNRDNTEPGNQTITSQEQAVLVYENNRWYIQDKSVMKTTFIHAGDKKELKSDDIITLGNRRFIFKT